MKTKLRIGDVVKTTYGNNCWYGIVVSTKSIKDKKRFLFWSNIYVCTVIQVLDENLDKIHNPKTISNSNIVWFKKVKDKSIIEKIVETKKPSDAFKSIMAGLMEIKAKRLTKK